MRNPLARSYPPIDLAGAVVVVTGGARGIGRATADLFAAQGATVAIGDLDADLARATAERIGGRACALDVSSRDSFADFIAQVTADLGPVDVLVNNAGIMPAGAFLDESEDSIDRQLAVNLNGVINGMRCVLPAMRERRRGHVVNVASMAGKIPIPGLAVYCAGKHAVVALSNVTRSELAPDGVSVSTVMPTAVRTELVSGIPMGRGLPAVDPEQVAEAVVATVRNRPAEVSVPRALRPLGAISDLTPEPVMRAVLKLVGGDRAITGIDHSARAGYVRRTGGR